MIKHISVLIVLVNFGLAGLGQPTQNFEKANGGTVQGEPNTPKPPKKRPNNYYLSDNIMKVDTTKASVEYWQNWMADLNDMGVEKKEDSFFVKKEVLKLMKDETYRKTIYPTKYNWPLAVDFMKKMELKKAFWQLINLYQTDIKNKNIVIGTVLKYDSLMAMDKILLSTFYTYSFTDPEIYRLTKNKPEIYRPDILEKKLRTTKEIVGYIWENRKNKSAKNGSGLTKGNKIK